MKLPQTAFDRIVVYLCLLAFMLIGGMLTISAQGREFPQSFENIALIIIGGIIGALKLQSNE